MFLKTVRAATLAAAMSSFAANAAIISGVFTGTATDGIDGIGVFQPAATDLTGAAVSGTYTYYTDLLDAVVSDPTVVGTGSSGALTVTVTMFGATYTFTDPDLSAVFLNSGTNVLSLQTSNTLGSPGDSFSLYAELVPGAIGWADLVQAIEGTSPIGSVGSLSIFNLDGSTNADFTLTSLSQTVPEPASFAVLFAGLAGLAVLRRRPQQAVPARTAF
ncbi:MAG: PEP-CTERM sorting domain-containing protein [Rhodospirillales bacterium]